MATILQQLQTWVQEIIASMGYVGIVLLMILENLFPPIPSEIVMPFAGSLAARGEFNIVGVFIAGTLGAVAGAVIIYYLGVWLSEDWLRNWFKNYGYIILMSEDDYENALAKFDKHGRKMVLIGRVMPAIRSLISIPAGLNKMALPTFLLYTTLGTAIWNVILLGAGYALGENWQRVMQFLRTYEYIFWAIIGLLVIYYVFKRLRSRSKEGERAST